MAPVHRLSHPAWHRGCVRCSVAHQICRNKPARTAYAMSLTGTHFTRWMHAHAHARAWRRVRGIDARPFLYASRGEATRTRRLRPIMQNTAAGAAAPCPRSPQLHLGSAALRCDRTSCVRERDLERKKKRKLCGQPTTPSQRWRPGTGMAMSHLGKRSRARRSWRRCSTACAPKARGPTRHKFWKVPLC